MRIPTLILVFAFAAEGQPTAAPQAARIEGLVRSANGEAIPRASLRLEGPEEDERPELTALSDDEGRFRFDHVPPGRDYFLTARRPGFVDARYGARSATGPGTPLTMERGAVVNDIVIAMTPQGVIRGRVASPSGDPLMGSTVMALQPVYERGERRISMAARAVTNDQGEYRIANLAPGEYYIGAFDRRVPNVAPGRPPEGYAVTYHPNGTDVRDAAPLRITGGAEFRSIDVRLRQTRVYAIRGKVVDASGAPANGTLLAVQRVDDPIADGVVTNARSGGALQPTAAPNATFEFRGLTPGTYFIQTLPGVRLNRDVTPPLVARVEVTITDQDVSGAVLLAGAGASVSGSVTMESGGIGALFPQGSLLAVGLEEVAPLALNTPDEEQISTDGTFRIAGAALTRHYLRVTGLPDNLYLKSARFNGADVTHAPIDLSSGAGGVLEIVLSPKAAGITGIVRDADGRALGAAQVTLWPAMPDPGSATRGIRAATSDQNGAFEFHGLAPGDYFLAAWEDADPGLLEYHPFLMLLKSPAAALTLGENAHTALEAPLIRLEKIRAAESQLP